MKPRARAEAAAGPEVLRRRLRPTAGRGFEPGTGDPGRLQGPEVVQGEFPAEGRPAPRTDPPVPEGPATYSVHVGSG